MKPVQSLLLLAAVAIASVSCSPSPQWKLELSSSTAAATDGQSFKIELKAAETTVVELLVVGSAPGSVQFTAANLPAFGTLQGPVLRFSPGRQDAGEYDVTVTATAGGDSQSVVLDLVVDRFNSAPTISLLSFSDNHGWRDFTYCPGPSCTLDGPARLDLDVCDAEGDGITVEVEVVRRGEPFTKTPTYVGSIPRRDPYVTGCGDVLVPLTGLTLEQSYDFAYRVSDEFGAVMKKPGAPDGWNAGDLLKFDQGPCTTRKCACVGSGPALCGYGQDYVCCSGTCTGSAASGYQCL
jgi:hypothetical protein